MQIIKCQDFAPRFLFLRNLLILGHITCAVINRCLYRRSVGLFNRNKFCAIADDIFSLVSLFNGNFYICKTCGKKIYKNCIPCQAVCNILEICEFPKEFRDIRRVKNVLVARQLIIPKVQSLHYHHSKTQKKVTI